MLKLVINMALLGHRTPETFVIWASEGYREWGGGGGGGGGLLNTVSARKIFETTPLTHPYGALARST